MPPHSKRKQNVKSPKSKSSPHTLKSIKSPESSASDKSTHTPPDAATYKSLGVSAFTNQKYLDAINYFSSSIELSPSDATLFSNRSAAYSAIDQYHSALIDAESTIKLKPNWSKGYYRRGIALEGLMKFDEALQSYQSGLKYDSNDQILLKAISDIESVIVELTAHSTNNNTTKETDKFYVLQDWLLSSGSKFPSIYLKHFPEGYRGVAALRTIKKDETILYVPRSHLLTIDVAKQSDIGTLIAKSGIELDDTQSYIAAFILQEREKCVIGGKSFWKPFLDILPSEFDSIPLFFNEKELQEMQGSLILPKFKGRQKSLKEEYENLVNAIDGFGRFSYEDFVWARLCVLTRTFIIEINGEENEWMVPLADMFNHSLPCTSWWGFDSTLDAFVVTAAEDILKSQQIWYSYGRKPNWRLLLNYGFCLVENEDNECAFLLSPPKEDKEFGLKKRLLKDSEFGAYKTTKFFITYDYRDDSTKECFNFLRFSHAHGGEMMLLNSSNENFDMSKVKPVSLRNELAVLKTLHDESSRAIKNFPTSIEEDIELLKNEELTFNMRNIILMRRGEKELLQYYIDLYPYIVSLTKMSHQEFNKSLRECKDMKRKTDSYVVEVVQWLLKGEQEA